MGGWLTDQYLRVQREGATNVGKPTNSVTVPTNKVQSPTNATNAVTTNRKSCNGRDWESYKVYQREYMRKWRKG